MTKTLIILLALLFISNYSISQTINIPSTLSVAEGEKMLDDVPRNGFSVALVGDEKDIIKSFEDYLENSNKKYDVKSFFKKISAENLFVPEFSDKHFNLNAEVRETDSKIELWYWVSFGADVYVNSTDYPSEAAKSKELLKGFAQKYFSDFIEADLTAISEAKENSTDKRKDIQKEISGLKKDQLKEQKKIKKLEQDRLELQEELADINIELKENAAETQEKEGNISVLNAELSKKTSSLSEVEKKLSEQEKTIEDLKRQLTVVKNL